MALNRVALYGRLTKDPDLRHTANGTTVAHFSIAAQRVGKDKTVDYFEIVAWGKLAEIVGEYLVKGRAVNLDGRLQTRSYEHDGIKRKVTEIVAENIQILDREIKDEAESKDDSTEIPF